MPPPMPPDGGMPPGMPGAEGGLPPELMAALGGAGPEGAPPGQEAPPEEKSSSDHLADAREALRAAFDAADDDLEKKSIVVAIKAVQDLFAKAQQEEEAASGTTAAHKGMSRALSAGG
jgi:hypothetical protein